MNISNIDTGRVTFGLTAKHLADHLSLGSFMTEQHPYRATILTVPVGTPRPLWSVMIPTYNCAKYLRETLASVLVQAPGADIMQIEVVDDHSTRDDPAAVVEELGHSRVGFYRQPENVGYIRNFETCLKRSRGTLIHLLHGDDRVRDSFYRVMQRAFDESPEIGAAFCRHIYMDEQGHWQSISHLEQPESGILSNCLERLASRQRIQTPSIVVRREVYEKLGGFDSRISCCGEDWEMWVRIAAHYPIWYEIEPLAEYRARSTSLSGSAVHTSQDIRDVLKAIDIYRSYLPKTIAGKLSSQAREYFALLALHSVRRMLAAGDIVTALSRIREVLKCSRSLTVIKLVIRLLIEAGAGWGRQYS
jgi:glycosyltransferase involved in cell wall biosynthesis